MAVVFWIGPRHKKAGATLKLSSTMDRCLSFPRYGRSSRESSQVSIHLRPTRMSVLVKVTMAAMKHHDQKQDGKERKGSFGSHFHSTAHQGSQGRKSASRQEPGDRS